MERHLADKNKEVEVLNLALKEAHTSISDLK